MTPALRWRVAAKRTTQPLGQAPVEIDPKRSAGHAWKRIPIPCRRQTVLPTVYCLLTTVYFEVPIMLIKLKQDFVGSAAGKVLDVAESEGKMLIDKGIADPAGDEALSQARRNSVPAIFGQSGDGDPKKNFGDWLSHAIKATTGKGREPYDAAD